MDWTRSVATAPSPSLRGPAASGLRDPAPARLQPGGVHVHVFPSPRPKAAPGRSRLPCPARRGIATAGLWAHGSPCTAWLARRAHGRWAGRPQRGPKPRGSVSGRCDRGAPGPKVEAVSPPRAPRSVQAPARLQHDGSSTAPAERCLDANFPVCLQESWSSCLRHTSGSHPHLTPPCLLLLEPGAGSGQRLRSM